MINYFRYLLISIFLIKPLSIGRAESNPPRMPVYSPLYSIQWSSNGEKCLIRPSADALKVYNAEGDLIWSKTGIANNASFSPSGEEVAYTTLEGGVFVHSFPEQQEREVFPFQGTNQLVSQLTWSPGGQRISFWVLSRIAPGSAKLIFIDPDGQNMVEVTTLNSPRFIPEFPIQNPTHSGHTQ
jgi:WD40 repeat protein